MAKSKGGFINKLIFGSEKSEGYARASLPSNRWELFFDILKGRFGKLVVINLLMVIFFIPIIALFVFYTFYLSAYGELCPYNVPFGVGFMAEPNFAGYAERIITTVDVQILGFLPFVAIIAAVGISGGAYVIRNMVWTEGIFVANDFWRGIKQNFLSVAIICIVYSILLYVSVIIISIANQALAIGQGKTWILTCAKILIISALALFTVMTFHMIAMVITYKLSFKALIKNSFIFTVGLLPQNVLFIFLAVIPYLLFLLGNFFIALGVIMALLFSFSYTLLVWTDFCQWAYDEFINSKVPGAKKNRGIYEKVKENDPESIKKYKQQLLVSKSDLSSRPIKPITDDEIKLAELPASFNRSDIEKLNESRQAIYEDNEKYIEEHKNDPEFQITEEQSKLIEDMDKKEREKLKRIERAKKELSKRNKK